MRIPHWNDKFGWNFEILMKMRNFHHVLQFKASPAVNLRDQNVTNQWSVIFIQRYTALLHTPPWQSLSPTDVICAGNSRRHSADISVGANGPLWNGPWRSVSAGSPYQGRPCILSLSCQEIKANAWNMTISSQWPRMCIPFLIVEELLLEGSATKLKRFSTTCTAHSVQRISSDYNKDHLESVSGQTDGFLDRGTTTTL